MAISVPSESSGKVAPKAKQQQDEAIIGTNDYSIMSKRSVEKLYYNDEPEFLRAFVHRFKRRAPLVNRGYWLRMRAIEAVVQRFLNENTSEKKAVVNLGCGYDPLAFRTLWKYPTQSHDVKFVDVDFPSLIAKKVQIIKNESCLRSQLNPADENPSHTAIKYANSKYCAVGCDLGDIDLLEYILKDHLNLDDFSVLFINEVAMVYMLPHEATDVVSLCSSFADGRKYIPFP
jgi:tRNA wybutosine-synthesizing protein 4